MAQDILITPGSGEPQILFRGSGTNDTPIELNVLSSYLSANGSGSALLFEGTEGQLFAITDNLSSGVIFSVADIAGLPLIEADASGDVQLIEYGRYVGVGTGTPAYQLDVFGTGRFSEGIIFPDGNTQTVAFTGDNDITYTASDGISLNGNNFILAGTGNLSKLTIDNGTDSALNVSGSVLLAGTGVVFEVQNTGGTALFAVEDSTEVSVVIAAQVGQTSFPFEVRDEFDLTAASIDVSGNISGNNISFGDGTTQTTAAGPAAVISDSNTGITVVCATHANSYLRTTSNSGVTITFPSGVGCDANSEFTFEQAGSGQITVTGEAGVTINTSSTTKSYTQFSVISLKQVATDTYTLFGDTASF
jgi:hypothetical protein